MGQKFKTKSSRCNNYRIFCLKKTKNEKKFQWQTHGMYWLSTGAVKIQRLNLRMTPPHFQLLPWVRLRIFWWWGSSNLGMQSTLSLPSLPGPLCSDVVALDRVLTMGQIELKCVLVHTWILEIELFWYLNCVLRYTELLQIKQFWHVNCFLILNWII